MEESEIQKAAVDLVVRVEQEQFSGLQAELNSMSIDDRLAVARAAEALNAQLLKSNPSLPDITIHVESVLGVEYLYDMTVTHDNSWACVNPFASERTVTDIYNEHLAEKVTRWLIDAAVNGATAEK